MWQDPLRQRVARSSKALPPPVERALPVLSKLRASYPEPYCFLDGRDDPFRLLTAVILSAQCTDAQVNRVTPALFAKFGTPEALARAPRADVEKLVYATGFYRNKAKNIQEMAAAVVERFGGEVPRTMSELVTLPGVGRKTANVVQANCFGVSEGVCVDTHVGRLARRLGFSKSEDPVKVEQDLMRLFPRNEWENLAYYLISHGRAVCDARKPACERCPLLALCPQVGVIKTRPEGASTKPARPRGTSRTSRTGSPRGRGPKRTSRA